MVDSQDARLETSAWYKTLFQHFYLTGVFLKTALKTAQLCYVPTRTPACSNGQEIQFDS